ncbi:MAG: tetratricopeptide (TPR) repeat protein [Planctomycetota bacterium]|jgi:tetratricopeptide (TPR) repeat protein
MATSSAFLGQSPTYLTLLAVSVFAWGFSGCSESDETVDNAGGVSRKFRNSRVSAPEIVENPAPMLTHDPDTGLPAESPLLHDAPAPAEPSKDASLSFPRVARALEHNQLEEASTLLTQADLKRIDTLLLRARLYLRQGETIQALREIELARTEGPSNGRVYGTAAELYIRLGRLDDAENEIRRGLAIDGGCAAMERARGVYFLHLPGAAMTAKIHLERALELEPDLAFAARPLAKAHRLIGRGFLRDHKSLEAVRSARAGLELYPDDFELRQLHADALLAAGSFLHAVEILEELTAEGYALENELALASWRAGMGELIRGKRSVALELFARARELGMAADDMGTASNLLGQESSACVARGVAAYSSGSYEDAREFFAEAAHFDPNNLAAANHLAVAHARLGMTELAIEGWIRVLSVFDESGTRPPEPIHLNLARAFMTQGEVERALRLLEHYELKTFTALNSEPSIEAVTVAIDQLESTYRSASLQRAE